MYNAEYKDQYYQDLLSWSELENVFKTHVLTKLIPYGADGSTCYFTGMASMTTKLNALAQDLEKEYNMNVDAHVYMCLDKSKPHPFGVHFDFADNVIVQCEGVTNFKVWDKVEETEKNYQMDIKTEPILDKVLRPGDAICIPRLYPHLATTLQDPRLSVSFPLINSKQNDTPQPRKSEMASSRGA